MQVVVGGSGYSDYDDSICDFVACRRGRRRWGKLRFKSKWNNDGHNKFDFRTNVSLMARVCELECLRKKAIMRLLAMSSAVTVRKNEKKQNSNSHRPQLGLSWLSMYYNCWLSLWFRHVHSPRIRDSLAIPNHLLTFAVEDIHSHSTLCGRSFCFISYFFYSILFSSLNQQKLAYCF